MKVALDPRASAEIEEAAEWYEYQRVGLGRELVAEVGLALQAMALRPPAGLPVEGIDPVLEVRRVRVRRFPYQVVYVTRADDSVVLAVAHDCRRPGLLGPLVASLGSALDANTSAERRPPRRARR